jgi:hypothetical protein
VVAEIVWWGPVETSVLVKANFWARAWGEADLTLEPLYGGGSPIGLDAMLAGMLYSLDNGAVGTGDCLDMLAIGEVVHTGHPGLLTCAKCLANHADGGLEDGLAHDCDSLGDGVKCL